MHRSWCLFVVLLSATGFSTGVLAQECNVASLEIEDGTASVVDLIDIADDVSIEEVTAFVDITHPSIDELTVFLESPEGTAIGLYFGGGDVDVADLTVTFSDSGIDHGDGLFDCDCDMKPSGPGSFADFVGQRSTGPWLLSVVDLDPILNSGTLEEWCVTIAGCELLAPVDLTCDVGVEEGSVDLSWINEDPDELYTAVLLYVNGELYDTLPSDEESATVSDLDDGRYLFHVVAESDDCVTPSRTCSVALGFREICADTVTLEPDVISTDPTSHEVVIPGPSEDDELILTDVDVRLDMFVLSVDRWTIDLVSPTGTSLTLHAIDDATIGPFDLIWSDDGILNGAPYDCRCDMVPTGPGAFSDFTDESSEGDWTFEFASLDSGGIDQLCIGFRGERPPVEVGVFEYSLTDPGAIDYDPADGAATIATTLVIAETTGDDPPSPVQGVSASLSYDDTALTASAVSAKNELADLNGGDGPDFLTVETSATGAGGSPVAVTIECIFDLDDLEVLEFDDPIEAFDIEFETIAARFIDDEVGTTTTLAFVPVGDPLVENQVTVEDETFPVVTTDLEVELRALPYSFAMRAVFRGIAVGYDQTTGAGDFPLLLTIEELDGEEHETGGFQASLAYDADSVTAVDVVPLGDVAALNEGEGPDFFDVDLAATADDRTGVTIDCLYDEDGIETLVFPEETRVAKIFFETIASTFEDDSEGTTLFFDHEALGDPTIESTVLDADGLALRTRTEGPGVDLEPFRSTLAFEATQNVATLSLKPVSTTTALLGGGLTVSSFSFSFTYPSDLVSVAEITEAALLTTFNNGDGPDLLSLNVLTDGETTGITIDVVFSYTNPDETLDVGDDGEPVIDVEFECVSDSEITEAVTLSPEVLGDPPIDNQMTDSDGNVLLASFESAELEVDCFRGKFARGDADGNGTVFPIIDALFILEYGFTDGPAPPCLDAADVDDIDGVFPILDSLFLLSWGFVGGPEPPEPGPDGCGQDPTDVDGVSCLEDTCDDD